VEQKTAPGRIVPDRAAPAPAAQLGTFRQVVPGQIVPGPAAPVREWTLVLADGQSIDVSGPVVLGRDPAALAGQPDARRVRVDDPAKSVSKTHAVVAVEGTGLQITDLHSTNGVAVREPDGSAVELASGSTAPLGAGCRILLGEFWIDVQRADGPHRVNTGEVLA
jgi:hypothetical protein